MKTFSVHRNECSCCEHGIHRDSLVSIGRTVAGFYTRPLRETYDGVYFRIGPHIFGVFKMIIWDADPETARRSKGFPRAWKLLYMKHQKIR